MGTRQDDIPTSVTKGWINLVGLAATFLALVWLCLQAGQVSAFWGALVLMAAYALPIAVLELAVHRVQTRPSTELNPWRSNPYNLKRSLTKFLGLTVMVLAVVSAHAVFRFYPVEDLLPALRVLVAGAPLLCVMAIAYILWVDARMVQPKDGYWQIGAWLTAQTTRREVADLRHFTLGWVIKGFFLPIMFFYLISALAGTAPLGTWFAGDIVTIARRMMLIAIILELVVVCVGYTLTLRLFDAHIRSTNPVLWGWLVTLICYAPFNGVVTGQIFDRDTGVPWFETIESYPLLAGPWLAVMLLSFAVWVWATASFGLRWSNLTNRGVITCGPYRWMKHPDYLSKTIFFWLTSMPILADVPIFTQIAATCGMCVVTVIYFARARAEERHMSEDPDYVRYALALNDTGLFAPLFRLIPALGYRPPDGAPGSGSARLPAAGVTAQ
ncbi:MAG: isoprenylcysteine carboxylmethyltransferase family protein [Pseudomonadota bacterium]